ncbi:cytochrome c [Paenibacillus thermoaerophilus]|nr:cytochrome c [Paenibacillus thermoaerophilus]
MIACLGVLTLTAGLAAGCGGGGGAAQSGEPREPEAIYKQLCINCHGNNLEGRSAPALKTIGATKSAEEIAGIIQKGQNGMPSFGKMLKPEEIQALADWLAAKK